MDTERYDGTKVYYSCFVSENLPEQLNSFTDKFPNSTFSGHITIAYGQEKLNKYKHILGQYVNLVFSSNIFVWVNDNGDKYAYRPVKVELPDGTDILTHESLHSKEPGWGTEHGLNHKHQASITSWTDSDVKYNVKSFVLSCPINFFNKYDPRVLCSIGSGLVNNRTMKLSPFGKFIKKVAVPFQLTTSELPESHKKLIKDLFPSCIIVSEGDKKDKMSRIPKWCVHYDSNLTFVKSVGGCHIFGDKLVTIFPRSKRKQRENKTGRTKKKSR